MRHQIAELEKTLQQHEAINAGLTAEIQRLQSSGTRSSGYAEASGTLQENEMNSPFSSGLRRPTPFGTFSFHGGSATRADRHHRRDVAVRPFATPLERPGLGAVAPVAPERRRRERAETGVDADTAGSKRKDRSSSPLAPQHAADRLEPSPSDPMRVPSGVHRPPSAGANLGSLSNATTSGSSKPSSKRKKAEAGEDVELPVVLDMIDFYRPSTRTRHPITDLPDEVLESVKVTLVDFTKAEFFSSLKSQVQKEMKCARLRALKRSNNYPSDRHTCNYCLEGHMPCLIVEKGKRPTLVPVPEPHREGLSEADPAYWVPDASEDG